jgi:3-oxoacyl-[acyl-carrier-protein] synthase II
MRRVVVTGLGMVSPIGQNVSESWKNALAGKSGVGKITRFDTTNYSVHIAAEVKDFAVGDAMDAKEAGRAPLFLQFAAKAAQEAMRDAKLTEGNFNPDRAGACVGVGIGSIDILEENYKALLEKGPRRVSPFLIPHMIANMASGLVSRLNNLKGPNMCTTTACASGTHGVGDSMLYIQNNMADIMLCGGVESAVTPSSIAGFGNMKALSTNNEHPEEASRPFDLNRDGFVMGEGAGLLVLEELEHAKKRGAKIYAELVGYGMSGDAYHITSPAPEGEGAQRCMKMALSSGKIPLNEMDYINAHGTSTKLNDFYETRAIRGVFGEHAQKISISSTKGVTGHCLGAAGGIEAVFTVKAIEDQIVPPTAGLKTPDPECDLDYTPGDAKRRTVRYAMSNSFGFGGTNATVAFKRYEP